MKTAVILLSLCVCLCACGQKGPLYIPQSDKPTEEESALEKAQR